jgi:hypothetical protein
VLIFSFTKVFTSRNAYLAITIFYYSKNGSKKCRVYTLLFGNYVCKIKSEKCETKY